MFLVYLTLDKENQAMKYFSLFCICLQLFSCLDKKSKNDLTKQHIYGKVKVLTQSFHEPIEKFGKIEYEVKIAKYSAIKTSTFNEQGLIMDDSGFGSVGNLKWKNIYTHDDLGNLIEIDSYDPDGKLYRKTINSFDKSGYLLDRNDFDAAGASTGKEIAKYDSAGNLIKETFNLVNGNLRKSAISKLDNKHHIIKYTYFANDSVVTKGSNKYDDNGNRIEQDEYLVRSKRHTLSKYKYDENHNEIEVVQTKNNLITSKVTSIYNDMGFLIESFIYGVGGSLELHRKHLYELDAANNWIKQTIIVDDKPHIVILHELEYY